MKVIDIILGIFVWLGCWSAMMVNSPEYIFTNAVAMQMDKPTHSYAFVKLIRRSYNILFLILLNVFCLISEFLVLRQDLKFVLFVINIIFFFNVIWDMIVNSYNKNYIAELQKKVVAPVQLKIMFDIKNEQMPNDYNCPGIYLLIRDKIYYKDDKISICLEPKKFGQKKSPIKLGEIKYIVAQLNDANKVFSEDVEVQSFYKHPDLYEYSDFIIYDEIKNNKFRKFVYRVIPKLGNILNTVFAFIYFALGIIAFASSCGSNWCWWFTLFN